MKVQVLDSDMQLIAEREITQRTRCHVSSMRLGRKADNTSTAEDKTVFSIRIPSEGHIRF